MRVGVYGLALIIAVGPSIPRLLGACSIALRYNGYFGEPPETPGDTTPPTLAVTYYIERPGGFGCCDAGPCGTNWGYIVLVPTTTDETPAGFIHYRFEILDGTPPNSRWNDLNSFVNGIDNNGEIGLSFDRDAEFTFDLEITAVDLNGNESAPVVLTIDD